MAKIACAKCGNQIDNFALTCPLCGVRTERGKLEDDLKAGGQRVRTAMKAAIFIAVLAGFWVLWNVLGSTFGRYGDVSTSPAAPTAPPSPATTDIPVR